ncbi:MAG: phytase [Pseudomonadota bacterium]
MILSGLMACAEQPNPPSHASAVPTAAETDPIVTDDDAADDPALWIAPDPRRSRIIGTDKRHGLYAYALSGERLQFLAAGEVNNVDVRQDVALNGRRWDIAAASHETEVALNLFVIHRQAGHLTEAATLPLNGFEEPYGLCLYRSPTDGALYAFVTDKGTAAIAQVRIRHDGDGFTAEQVRRLQLETVAEGCAADDRTGKLYLAEEHRGLWRFGAEPGDGDRGELLARIPENGLTSDLEGVALLPADRGGGHVMVSSQGNDSYFAYRLQDGRFAGSFHLAAGATDAVTHTDGIEITTRSLGARFPEGILVVQDDENTPAPGQNFKIADLRDVEAIVRPPSSAPPARRTPTRPGSAPH